jgi:dTMP kinase
VEPRPTEPSALSSRGRLITLEGPEGAGKTLQADRLAAELEDRGHRVVLTREPGGTSLGNALRELLLSSSAGQIAPRADALLFNAARAQLVTELIAPSLETGTVVVCARFSDSTLAYQGYGEGIPLDLLRSIADVATAGLTPDRTILLDVDPAVGLGRKRPDDRTRFETSFGLPFHERVRRGFLELASLEPDRFRIVDASRDVDAVFMDVLGAALEVLTGPA